MILNVFAFIFVLGITFIHSIFGLYSGLINVFCSVTSLAVAFGYYEALTDLLTKQFELPAQYVEPAVLVLLFVIPLGVLRYLADRFLRGNVHVPMYVDWAGGAVCGFINAQIAVGVLLIGFLMLPFGGRVAMFSRYERDPDNEVNPQTQRVQFARNSIWLRSDKFATGLFSMLSSGSLKGGTVFREVYPDYPEWVFWSGNTVQSESSPSPLRDKDHNGFGAGISVERWWTERSDITQRIVYRKELPTRDRDNPPYSPQSYKIQPGDELVGVRVKLTPGVGDAAKDRRGTPTHRFRPSMFRLVGTADGKPRQYIPQIIGGADPKLEDKLRIVDLDANFSPEGATPEVDLYFEVPQGFTAHFVEYRRHARAALSAAQEAKTPPADRLAEGEGGGAQASNAPIETHGQMRFINTVERDFTGPIDRLPFPMSASRLGREQVDVSGGKLVGGRVTGTRAELEAAASDTKIETYAVPDGRRMFQLQTQPRRAASLAGQVFNFVGGTVNQYSATSSTGDVYPLSGYYAIVERDGQPFIELHYVQPDSPEGMSFRGTLDFETPGMRKMLAEQDGARLGLLFLVPPGVTITGIRAGTGSIDLGDAGFKIDN